MNADDFLPNAETVAAIEKDIASYNERRRFEHAALERSEPVLTMAYFGGVALLTWLVWLLMRHTNPFIALLVPPLGIGLWPQAQKRIRRDATWTQQNFRDHIVPVMLGFLPGLRYGHGITPGSFSRIPKPLLPHHNQKTFGDVITASLEGRPFQLFEARLVLRSKNSETVGFEGVILNCRRPEAFDGVLVATRKAGDWHRFFRDLFGTGGLSEMTVPDRQLAGLYEFRSDKRGHAQALLGGGFAEMLVSISKLWPQETPQVAVSGEDVFVLLPTTRNFFELPPIDRPVDYGAHIEPMARQFAGFLAIVREVDRLDAPQEAPAAETPAVAQGEAAATPAAPSESFIPLLDGGAKDAPGR